MGAARITPLFTFRATTTLDVREWPDGLPSALEADHLTGAASARPLGLVRGVFPRPYAISSLARRDITMQGVEGEGVERLLVF